MRRIWAAVLVFGVTAGALSGCSSDAASGGGTAKLGETCSASVKCAEGDCATKGFCATSCANHSDCGCPAGTTDATIANGACQFACTDNQCLKVCSTYRDCGGDASCNVTGHGYMACE